MKQNRSITISISQKSISLGNLKNQCYFFKNVSQILILTSTAQVIFAGQVRKWVEMHWVLAAAGAGWFQNI